MALLTLTQHKTFAGITSTDVVRDASLSAIIDEVIDVVKRYCNNGDIEATEYTQVLDAPPYPSLVLPFAPVIYDPDADEPIDFQLYRLSTANGDPSAFTAADLLTIYTDYTLDIGPANTTVSETGIVRFFHNPVGLTFERPLYSLSVKPVPLRGAIKVVYTAGYQTVPPAIQGAINLMVRKIFNSRKIGGPLTGESLNGYSYSAQQSATANGILYGDPTVQQMLRPFCRAQIGGYY